MCDVPVLSLKDGAVWSVSLSDKVQVFYGFYFVWLDQMEGLV